MNKIFKSIALALVVSFCMTSCYTYRYNVGEGPQSGVEIKQKNHYFIYGLAPGTTSDPIQMAGDTNNYEVKIEHTFIDGLLNAITWGIYTPTTTTVTK